MALVKFIKTTNSNLSSLTKKEGQLIFTTDTKKLYLDNNSSTRLEINSYNLTQDGTDGHKLTFTDASGTTHLITIPDNNTTYTGSNGITLTGTNFTNSGVRSVATGSANGTISVNTNGTAADVAVKGLAALAYKASLSASDVGAIDASLKGANSGVAELDANGKVPSSQLPSYVDDIIEGYYYNNKFYKESTHTTEITGETGKIYVDLSTDKTYRWSGSAYVVISETLALGETSATAYRGDRGKIAYDHSQSTHARTDATKTESSTTNGNIKINGTETTVYTHPAYTETAAAAKKVGLDATGHVVLGDSLGKSDVGLGNVGNFKAVSTVASQGLSDTEKSNARANIGAGTSSLTLGTGSSNAYRGDYGNTAYTHATDSSRLTTATSSGLYKVASTAQGHIASLTSVEKADITALGIPGSDTTYSAGTGMALSGTTFKAKLASDTASSLASTAMGSTSSRQYAVGVDKDGYLSVNIPWTDTKNSAGSTDTSSKIYLVGATSQAANPQTYSDNEVFATSGVLQAKQFSVNGGANIVYNSTDKCIEFNFA